MKKNYVRMSIVGIATLAFVVGCTPQLSNLTTTPVADASSATSVTEAATAEPTATAVVANNAEESSQQTVVIESTQEEQLISLYDELSPSVVNISVTIYYYDRFMGSTAEEGTGSGFVFDTEGHILTNYHVVEDADEVIVTLSDGESYTAEVVGYDAVNDLAVLYIDAGDSLPDPLIIGDSDNLRVGQTVLAIGNPYGLDQTLTTGIISALGRVIESPEDDRFIGEAIQTDAAINPGNSGGPLINLSGEVIGINSQIISESGSSSGIGFAVSSATIKRVVPVLIEEGTYEHPYIGASMLTLSESLTEVLNEAGADISVDSGLLISSIVAGGPADEAGILGGDQRISISGYQFIVGGDIIIGINDTPIEDFEDLTLYLETETQVGDEIELLILRDSQEMTISLELGATPVE